MGDFGEPWTWQEQEKRIMDKDGDVIILIAGSGIGDRACDCVNALDGIDDPVAWRKAVEKLIRQMKEKETLNQWYHDELDAIEKARLG